VTPDPRIGTIIGGCRIESELGRGGMGVVYRAEQVRLGRTVAVKVIAPELARDPGFRERFERESRVAASIEHPNVIPVYEAGETDGELYITMRYVEGTDLRALIARSGRLEPARAAQVVAQVGAALDAAHSSGLVHRDVKPGNVLVATIGGRDHAYLTDFGLTKRLISGAGLTRTGEWVGTVDYVAPEQIEGKAVDARADIYALACVLHQALTGQVPYVRDSDVAKMYAHLHEPPPAVTALAPDVPPEFDGVVARGMAKDPDERYPSAGDLGQAALAAGERREAPASEHSVAVGAAAPGELTAVTEPLAVTAPAQPQPTEVLPQPRRRRGPLLAVAGVLLAAVVVAGGLLAAGVFSNDEPKPKPKPKPATVTTTTPSDNGGGKEIETTPASDAGTYTASSYTAEYPAGWKVAEDDVPKTTYSRTKFVSPDKSQSVLIDHSPGADNPPSESAAAVEAATAKTPGYTRLSFDATTINGADAFEWTFELGSTRKIDIFLTAGGDGYAVLGEGADFEKVIGYARDVAASIQPRG
jgi:tRNA A-37 threonylcarbamoyl transferase component Bud32